MIYAAEKPTNVSANSHLDSGGYYISVSWKSVSSVSYYNIYQNGTLFKKAYHPSELNGTTGGGLGGGAALNPTCTYKISIQNTGIYQYYIVCADQNGNEISDPSDKTSEISVDVSNIQQTTPDSDPETEGETSHGSGTGEVTINDESKSEIKEYKKQVNSIYKKIVKICMPVAAVAFAFNGFRMLFTISDKNDREGTRCKKIMFYIIVGTIVLYLLPTMINAGVTLGTKYAWSPV